MTGTHPDKDRETGRFVERHNLGLFFDAVRENEPVDTKTVAEATGYSRRQTVRKLRELADRGVVEIVDSVEGRSGVSPTSIRPIWPSACSDRCTRRLASP